MPAGKYTTAGVVVEEAHFPGAHRLPSLIAFCIAAVSSVTPSLRQELVDVVGGGVSHVPFGSVGFHVSKDRVTSVSIEGSLALMSNRLIPVGIRCTGSCEPDLWDCSCGSRCQYSCSGSGGPFIFRVLAELGKLLSNV